VLGVNLAVSPTRTPAAALGQGLGAIMLAAYRKLQGYGSVTQGDHLSNAGDLISILCWVLNFDCAFNQEGVSGPKAWFALLRGLWRVSSTRSFGLLFSCWNFFFFPFF